jgi:hypothetical protein
MLKIRTAAAIALTAAALSAGALATPAFAAAQPDLVHPFGGCGQVFNGVQVDGGEASWTITCTNGTNAQISGWVRDTKADGKCAYIKAFAGNGESRVPLAQACPKGTTTFFDWTTNGASSIDAYLFTA